ncbi:hypothetical protein PEPS_40480 (plasmid) [Persicobacter psychrovividus]|uniref:Lipid A 3-O-deacylase PagL n=2 Tax=Persicobacter psychrovividus TaxID=387638 RepID=A0ABM7VLB9_9BACT|nr:hypothetical protein PEPS_40480 [Persicobacter psychrovividus]
MVDQPIPMKHFTYIFAAAFLLLMGPFSATASSLDSLKQHNKRNFHLRFKYQAGAVLLTNDFLKGNLGDNKEYADLPATDYYQSFAIEFGKQTFGEHDWEHAYNFPKYGIGFYTAHFFDVNNAEVSSLLGQPSAIYGYFEGPFKRWNRFSFGYRIGFGLTYNWNPYHPADNPFQIAIGSSKTVYIEAALKVDYELTDRWELSAGAGFTHFSNGASSTPNYGINLMAPYLAVQYNFNNNLRRDLVRKQLDPIEKKKELNIGLSFTSKQIDFDTDKVGEENRYANIDYLAVNLTAYYMKRISQKSKFGAGLDLNYDESINAQVDFNEGGELEKVESLHNGDKVSLGGYAAYELVLDRLSILINAGAYILRKDDYSGVKPIMYQRIGLKYNVYNDITAGIYVRAYHFSVADFLEWQIGYRFGQ